MRRFNTEGPIRPEDHYHIPPLERVDLDQILDMIQNKRYFVLHAPRQTGKTSALLALRDLLNRGEAGDFRTHSEHWLERFEYQKAGPQLILQAFLQRVVNGGGRIEREYGLGRGRTDPLILWPEGDGPSDLWSKFVVECKVLFHEGKRQSLEGTIAKGLEQTLRYMDRCGSEAGHLIVFDRTEGKRWAEKVFRRAVRRDGRTVIVWGM